ncbi:10422_t:CDS:2 [Entrophospora sp. SA101]|nr:10422_t:CDS:2 [Entrophospora sp. SA101]
MQRHFWCCSKRSGNISVDKSPIFHVSIQVTKTPLDPNTTTFEQNPPETVSTNSEKIKSHSGAESTTFSSQVDVSLSGTKNHEADDKVSLTLLLVSGKRHTFSFDPNDTILTVKQKVFSNWPKEWADETPSSISSLKIVYRGRFLEDISTLESNKILRGQPTIAHLTFKNILASDLEGLLF